MKTKEQLQAEFDKAQKSFNLTLSSGKMKDIQKAAGTLALARKERDSYIDVEAERLARLEFRERIQEYRNAIDLCRSLGVE